MEAKSANKPLVHIGWILATDVKTPDRLADHQAASQQLATVLRQQFPQFEWLVSFKQRRRFPPQGALAPLPLLEYGVRAKIADHWDYALVWVSNELTAHQRVYTVGIPSSALETAVVSTTDLEHHPSDVFRDSMVALAQHLLGHVWGVEHCDSGPMVPPEDLGVLALAPFPDFQQEAIIDRLEEVADKRLEERSRDWNAVTFYWLAFWADPKSILIDIVGYAPWLLPFRMERLTAATAVSLIVLLITAEAWEIGVNLSTPRLAIGTAVAILIATSFIFGGQNLGQISRDVGWREQLTRTRIVIWGTVFVGMVTLWLVLFLFSLLVGWLLPASVLEGWVQVEDLSRSMILRHASFMAMVGVLAGALGGNLEEEEAIKAGLFFDEET